MKQHGLQGLIFSAATFRRELLAPPVADIPHLNVGLRWHAIILGHVVARFTIDDPKIHFELKNVQAELQNNYPIKNEGWQQAAESIYPVNINVFRLNNADVTYIAPSPAKPLH